MIDEQEFLQALTGRFPDLGEGPRELLVQYGRLLAEEAARRGTVARGDLPRLGRRHLLECLVPELVSAVRRARNVLDVGSGGGLPGIPLAIVAEDTEFTLLEPRRGRAAFLSRVSLQLGLGNVVVVESALEGFAGRTTGTWDLLVVRGLRMTRRMLRAAEQVAHEGTRILRFGPPIEEAPGWPIPGVRERVVQVWGRHAWSGLTAGS